VDDPAVAPPLVAACLDAARRSYSTCPVAVSADVLVPPFFWRVPLAEAEQLFAAGEYGVYCGGNAWHLVQLLDSEGTEAFTFNFAVDGRSARRTHVIVLARHAGELLALDPYYGHYLADRPDGSPVPFASYLAGLRSAGGEAGDWLAIPGVDEKRLLLGDPATIRRPGEDWLGRGQARVEGRVGNRLRLRHPPPASWVASFAAQLDVPAARCAEGLLRPLNMADSSGQSLDFESGVGSPPESVRLLARELGLAEGQARGSV
jgi:hypothetical protein